MPRLSSKHKIWLLAFTFMLLIVGLVSYSILNQNQQQDSLTIGINTPTAKTMAIAVEEAKKQGIHVKLVEFADWNTPNITLEAGDIDANYFQHQPYLSNESKQRGYQFKVAGVGSATHVGLYSKKYHSLSEIPVHAQAVVPNDPVNQGRALLLFQHAKLISLKNPNDYLSSLKDIQSNPKQLRFTEVEGPQTARALDDVDIAFGYPNYLLLAKNHDPNDALILDPPEGNRYALLFVTRQDYQDTHQKLAKFIHIFQTSARVRASIDDDSGQKLWYADWK